MPLQRCNTSRLRPKAKSEKDLRYLGLIQARKPPAMNDANMSDSYVYLAVRRKVSLSQADCSTVSPVTAKFQAAGASFRNNSLLASCNESSFSDSPSQDCMRVTQAQSYESHLFIIQQVSCKILQQLFLELRVDDSSRHRYQKMTIQPSTSILYPCADTEHHHFYQLQLCIPKHLSIISFSCLPASSSPM